MNQRKPGDGYGTKEWDFDIYSSIEYDLIRIFDVYHIAANINDAQTDLITVLNFYKEKEFIVDYSLNNITYTEDTWLDTNVFISSLSRFLHAACVPLKWLPYYPQKRWYLDVTLTFQVNSTTLLPVTLSKLITEKFSNAL